MTIRERTIETIARRGLMLRFFAVPWDTEIFGHGVVEVETIELTGDADPSIAITEFEAWLDSRDIRLVTCRIDSLRLRESMLLEDLGFRFIEMVYSPVLAPVRGSEGDDDGLVISEALRADRARLDQIASSVFTTGRYYLDWRLDTDASHRRYRHWLLEALDDSSQVVLKASVGDQIVGFFVVADLPERAVYWHLTAVAPEWQGRGVGKRLWRAMIARHQSAGVERIATTVSAHNLPVINLYAALGFRFTSPRATYHWLRS